jgi:transposase InsO family protein
MRFVARLLDGERMSELCREFGISRKTGYKLKERYDRLGPEGLYDASRRPTRSPRTTAKPLVERIIAARKAHPTWGPRKLRSWLMEHDRGVQYPVASTIGEILAKHGLVAPRRLRKRLPVSLRPLQDAKAPNDLWCVDYKGQFRLGNGSYCYPLTLTDQVSRYLLACEGFEAIDGAAARTVFEGLFAEFGLPRAIRSDGGAPFASRGLLGLSKLSAYWVSLGIAWERIAPGHPEQNGRHERMHRTLKAETTRPAGQTLLHQQERFDTFREHFNRERPHEALGQRPPSSVYVPSAQARTSVGELDYPLHDDVRTVAASGHIHVLRRRGTCLFLSSSLAGQRVGLREIEPDRVLITFADLDLGVFDLSTRSFDVYEAPSS